MMLVDNHPMSFSSVQSYSHYLNVPTLVPGGSGNNIYNPYIFDISLLPPTTDAIVDVIKHFQWNSVVYYLWDTNDGKKSVRFIYNTPYEVRRFPNKFVLVFTLRKCIKASKPGYKLCISGQFFVITSFNSNITIRLQVDIRNT